ncbi:glutamine--tRNA ligase/YqeY domain fusion protein [Chondromyces apiculatus]|uniref:Glutamine--tRNA ligase n=1 Tax=Chondromyces apiculatus DSM 436 TaxID=1192034 RepID=A0A017T091_9BACT|nr:glutamine--tRNA ligase/YqeY domain fusion protein [Chondromyces apiculatus]EYF02654.1 Glutaminyl-tRNA synthetase [Chondromyces apiculatus DSM 436]
MATTSERGASTPARSPADASASGSAASNFIREIVDDDLRTGRRDRVVTRFPPEPNGYLHIGHAKAICLNFGLARDYQGVCHLRLDDTNPTTEDVEYVEAIQRDVRWLGFDWADKQFYASDYYERLHGFAEALIRRGKAYVCSLSEEDTRKYRGSVSEAGTPSPYRDRSVEENLDLLGRMRKGEFKDGAHVVRAKIDMANPNMKMRDPPIVRIRHAHHYRTGDAWCLYPLYDFAHALSDWIEGITHSICTLEFENNRELYDWFLEALDLPNRPRQYEFARLNLTYTMMSKRKLLQLVEEKHVNGWDDPRMPTLAGMRRRGYTPESIRNLCERVGVAKTNSIVDVALLEHVVREDLNPKSPRVMCVLRPLKVVIESWPEDHVEELDAPYWPPDVGKEGSRKVPLSREIFIERDDFLESPPKDWHRLAPGREVRLRHGYVVTCTGVEKDEATGEIKALRCTHDSESRGGGGKKVKGTIHWVSARHAVEVEARLYDRLFDVEQPGSGDLRAEMNPTSLTTLRALAEPSLKAAKAGDHVQFERLGFFFVDPVDSRDGAPIFNRTVALKDTWSRQSSGRAGANEGAAPPTLPLVATPESGKQAEDGKAAAQKGAQKAEGKAAAPRVSAELSPEAQVLKDAHGITGEEARILAGDADLKALFEAAVAAHPSAKAIARWVVNEVRRELKGASAKALPFSGAALGELVSLVEAGTLSAPLGKEVLAELAREGGSPKAIVEKRGLTQISDTGAVEAAIDAVLAENADTVARFRAGNQNVLGALVGMAMKKTGGKANPKLVNELLRKKLGATPA